MSQFGNHDDRPTKTVELSRSEVTHVVMQIDINGQGRLFGITASVDNLTFKAEARLNDMVVMIGKVTHVGNSSMEVRVDSYRENEVGMRTPINRAYLTYVAVTPQGKPIPVPYGLEVNGPGEEAEWQGAEKRQKLRLERRKEAF